MGTLQTENEKVLEMNDSGYIHDDTPPSKKMTEAMATESGSRRNVNLMDLSDDVLLYILRHCSPMDLKALGYTCARLGALVLDRSLWQQVEVNDSVGRERFSWLLAHALHSGTESLKVQGFAKLSLGCLGHVNFTRKEVERNERWAKGMQERERELENSDEAGPSTGNGPERPPRPKSVESSLNTTQRLQNHLQISFQQLPRLSGSPLWPDEVDPQFGANPAPPTEGSSGSSTEEPPTDVSPTAHSASTCPGPLFTVTTTLLKQLRTQCPNLTSLALEYCNINCKTTSPNLFPPTLKRLSLRGTKCYNLPLDKSFLFRVQDCLPDLEYLDVSACDWFEPASLMPISKMPNLLELRAAYCNRLKEFVAYASIACRYGFRKLESIDLRGSPVGDSEVSALGWLPELRELRLAAAPRRAPRDHTHYRHEPLARRDELAPWELQEPEYYKRHNVEGKDSLQQALREEDKAVGTQIKKFDDITVRYFRQTEVESTSDDSERTKQYKDNDPLQNPGSSGQNSKRRHEDKPKPKKEEPNCKKKKTQRSEGKSEKTSSDSDSDDDGQSKSVSSVNCGASTSKMPVKRKFEIRNLTSSSLRSLSNHISQNINPPQASGNNDNEQNGQSCSQKQEINGQKAESSGPSEDSNGQRTENNGQNGVGQSNGFQENDEQRLDDGQRRENRVRMPPDAVIISRRVNEVHPRHQVLYVNVGQQLHAVYRLSIENERSICEPLRHGHGLNASPSNLQNLLFCPPSMSLPDINPTSLVTDSSIRRFGQSDNDNVSYVNIGFHGPFQREPERERASRSNLRVLSVRSFRYITNASLMHLATAAPYLRLVDFSDTMVTPQGVEYFMSLRPDVEVRYSKFDDSDTYDNDQQTETLNIEISMLGSP